MGDKLVSVCINCYNAEETIEYTLRSVLEQTYRRLQVIVVDDASTDSTREILRRFKDKRLELCFLEENGHISNANNEALARCKGDYVAHLDADDRWTPDKIAAQVAFLEAHPEYGAVFSMVTAVDEDGNEVEDHRFRAVNLPQAAMFRYLLENGNFLCHSSLLARKEVMEQVGRYDVSLLYLHDFDYWVRMCQVCAMYVMDEPFVQYRIASNSNSNRPMTAERFGAHMVEHARIHYRAILRCPDELFLEAFSDRLRRPDLNHNHRQTELEKAFVLLDMLTHLPKNPALGLRRLAELLDNATYRTIARRDFGLTAREFYRLQEAVVFHNDAELTHYKNVAGNNEAALKTVKKQFDTCRTQLRDEQEARVAAETRVKQLEAALHGANSRLALMGGSRWWRLGAPLRWMQRRRLIDRTAKQPRLKDGRPAKAVVAVYGFFGHNVGDDLFFDRLFRRYPDTVFVAFDAEQYEDFFAAYPNVYGYTRSCADVASIESHGGKDAFERLMLSKVQAVVHIGGLIYQQIGDWETDMKVRQKRYDRSRPFFSISSNFGPFHTEEYRRFWKQQFEKAGDICFRDTYSASLFEDVDTVRCAPDLLFSQPLPDVPREKNRLFLSVIDPAASFRSFTAAQCEQYYRLMTEVTVRWLQAGGSVDLAAFCPYEGDLHAVQTVADGVPEALHGRLTQTIYTSSMEAANGVLEALCRSSHVLATRFHAMVFGFASGARTLPLCYNQKMDHVLQDASFGGTVLSLESLSSLTAVDVIAQLRRQRPFDVSAMRTEAMAQFASLDNFLRQKDAAVKEDVG